MRRSCRSARRSSPPGAAPGAPLQYDVTLQGVAAPAPGTIVLAAESAPIAGKVVATRVDAAGLVVTLALAPLPQLFRAYDIDWKIALSAFPATPAPPAAAQQSLGAAWSEARAAKAHALAAKRPLDTLSPFKPFDCEASIQPQLVEHKATLALDNKLDLVIKDEPGYSRHSLEGTATITGSAGVKLKAGFSAKGSCEATAQLKLPVLGWVSVIVMPAVRFGLGGGIEGEVLIVQGELAVEGDVTFTALMGWECGGATPDCRSLDSSSAQDHFRTRSKFPSEHDMQVKVSGQFYVLAGLDASLLMGLGNAKIVEARIGPKQSFDLAFEEDQAARVDYASSYDLKLEGVVEPGSALKKAIAAVIGDDSVELTFKAGFSDPISESPKGTLSTDKARVAIAAPIVFTVDFDANTVAYKVLGYNITGVELYRRRDDEVVFTPWKAMDLIASTKATYTWTPEAADAGNYEFAAFVNTQIQPLPWLEVAPSSVQKVEVSCFTAGIHAIAPGRPRIQAASACRPAGDDLRRHLGRHDDLGRRGLRAEPDRGPADPEGRRPRHRPGAGTGVLLRRGHPQGQSPRHRPQRRALRMAAVRDRHRQGHFRPGAPRVEPVRRQLRRQPADGGRRGHRQRHADHGLQRRDEHDHHGLSIHVGAAGRAQRRRPELEREPPAVLFVSVHAPVERQRRVRNRAGVPAGSCRSPWPILSPDPPRRRAPPRCTCAASRAASSPAARRCRSKRAMPCCSPTSASKARPRAPSWRPCCGPTPTRRGREATCASACSGCASRSAPRS